MNFWNFLRVLNFWMLSIYFLADRSNCALHEEVENLRAALHTFKDDVIGVQKMQVHVHVQYYTKMIKKIRKK